MARKTPITPLQERTASRMQEMRARLRLGRPGFGLLTRIGEGSLSNYEARAAAWPAHRLTAALPAILADCDQLEKDVAEVRRIAREMQREQPTAAPVRGGRRERAKLETR